MKKTNITAKGYERKVAARFRKKGYTVLRADHANYMPDFMLFDTESLGFVECKRYLSFSDPKKVIKRIQTRQAKQWARMKELSRSTAVMLYIMTKGGKETAYMISGDYIYEIDPL